MTGAAAWPAEGSAGLGLHDRETERLRRRGASAVDRREHGLIAPRLERLALDATAEQNLVEPCVRGAGERRDRDRSRAAPLVAEAVRRGDAATAEPPTGRARGDRDLDRRGLIEREREDRPP